MKYKIIILFPFETYRIENCFKRFVYKKVYNRVDIRVVFYTIVHRSSLIIHLPISFCFFRQLGHTFASLGISVLQCLHNFVSFLFSFSIIFFPIFLSFLGKYFRTALFWNEIKYASRILLVIAAVVKVLCKHRLWLVAHVKKLPSETLLFMFRTTAIFCESKQNDKPGYVLNGHLSNPAVASRLQRPT